MDKLHHKLAQCKVRFDFSDTPPYWVPGEAGASQVMNVLHMLLPSGELWFCCLYNKVLLLASGARLCDDAQGFTRQEAMHSRAHDGATQRYLSRFDIDSKLFTDKMDFLLERLFCDYLLGQNRLTRTLDGRWLCQHCAIITAAEHSACVLGKWVLEARKLDRRDSDPVIFSLLRRHGAEEVEHRSVAHSPHVHLGGNFATRQPTMLLVIAILVYLFADGTRTPLDQDPSLRGAKRQGFLRTWWRPGKQGLLLNLAHTFRDVARYFNPWYHPEYEANIRETLEYLVSSPAARRAVNAWKQFTGNTGKRRGSWNFPGAYPLLRQVESNKPADGR